MLLFASLLSPEGAIETYACRAKCELITGKRSGQAGDSGPIAKGDDIIDQEHSGASGIGRFKQRRYQVRGQARVRPYMLLGPR